MILIINVNANLQQDFSHSECCSKCHQLLKGKYFIYITQRLLIILYIVATTWNKSRGLLGLVNRDTFS